MRNGHKINVDDMSESHLRNTLKMLIRGVDSLSIRRATRRGFIANGEMAREDADNYDIYKVTGMLPEDDEAFHLGCYDRVKATDVNYKGQILCNLKNTKEKE